MTVKNESAATVEFPTPGGVVKLEAGKSEDLTDKQLKSPGFADAVLAGKVSIGPVNNPGKDQTELAKAVLPPIVTGAGAKIAQLKARFDQSQNELLKLREAFNKTRKVVESNLDAAQSSVSGWPGLRKAVKTLIFDAEAESADVKQKRDALKAVEKELEDLKMEDLAVTKRTREAWFEDRLAKEQAVKDARDALAKVNKEKANPMIAEVETLDGRIEAVKAIAKHKVIGKEIPEFGP